MAPSGAVVAEVAAVIRNQLARSRTAAAEEEEAVAEVPVPLRAKAGPEDPVVSPIAMVLLEQQAHSRPAASAAEDMDPAAVVAETSVITDLLKDLESIPAAWPAMPSMVTLASMAAAESVVA